MSRVKPEHGFQLNRELQLRQVSPSALRTILKRPCILAKIELYYAAKIFVYEGDFMIWQ